MTANSTVESGVASRSGVAAAVAAYRAVLVVGLLAQLGFALVALFAPDMLSLVIGVDHVEFSYVWLGNVGMLLLAYSAFFVAIARDPERLARFAWLAVAGKAASTLYWMLVVRRPHGVDFVPWEILDAVMTLLPAVLLQVGPAEARLGRQTIAQARAALAKAAPNARLAWFRRVMWLGLAVNAGFILSALAMPAAIRGSLGAGFVDLAPVWLGGAAVTLFAVSLLYLPVAADPQAAPGVSWLVVASRFVAAAFWVTVALGPRRAAFWGYFASDFALGAVLAFILQTGASPEDRVSGEAIGRFLSALLSALTLRGRSIALRVVAALLAVVGGFAGYFGWYYFVRQVPDATFANPEEQYKYGAIGLGPAARIPAYLWDVMPELCASALPDADGASALRAARSTPEAGWASFGFIFEPGHDTPIGLAHREIGYPSLEPTCSLCHTGTYRASAADAAHVIPGAPAHELDLERFQRFLYSCASSPGFTGAAVVGAIEKRHPLGPVEAAVYRYAIVPTLQGGLARQQRDYAWQHTRPVQGRGRTDTFNPTKFNVFHFADDGSIGTTDLPAVWNQAPRERLWLHWDGNNNQIRERNFAAAMAVGATPQSVQTESFTRVTDYLLGLPSARYPFPIDAEKAARGGVTYARECAGCHAFTGSKVGQTTPIGEVGTDRHRLDSFTAELVSYFHEVDLGLFKFDAYRKTDGYSNLPIDGIWARAPYLHHGAVPTLYDLLLPPARRPRIFYRGYDVFDPVKVGFVSQGAEAEAVGFRYDVDVPGNDNGGHTYGTALSAPERDDLLEFLKTL